MIFILLVKGVSFEELLDAVEEVYGESLNLGVREHRHILLNAQVLLIR